MSEGVTDTIKGGGTRFAAYQGEETSSGESGDGASAEKDDDAVEEVNE